MNYEDFCHIASVCTEQIGPKCRRFFSPSNFMKFEKDESGRIAILPFYLYVMRTVSRAFWDHAIIHNFLSVISLLKLILFFWALITVHCYSGFAYTGQNRYEWAWRGFWWISSASCMTLCIFFNTTFGYRVFLLLYLYEHIYSNSLLQSFV
jgi:hypothetical protein